jgi:hypothetical protein
MVEDTVWQQGVGNRYATKLTKSMDLVSHVCLYADEVLCTLNKWLVKQKIVKRDCFCFVLLLLQDALVVRRSTY